MLACTKKGGNMKKDEKQKKQAHIHVMVTSREKEMFDEAATRSGLSISSFLRAAAFAKISREQPNQNA